MQCCQPLTERRKHPRFTFREQVFLLIESDRRLGELIDLSRGGVSFRYLADDRTILEGGHLVDIFTSAEDLWLAGLPATTVTERPDLIPSLTLTTRIAALQFGFLLNEQRLQLDQLLVRAIKK